MQMACAQYDEKLVCYLFCGFFRFFLSMAVPSRHRRHRARSAIRLIIETYN
jgi:hypothetical protein